MFPRVRWRALVWCSLLAAGWLSSRQHPLIDGILAQQGCPPPPLCEQFDDERLVFDARERLLGADGRRVPEGGVHGDGVSCGPWRERGGRNALDEFGVVLGGIPLPPERDVDVHVGHRDIAVILELEGDRG